MPTLKNDRLLKALRREPVDMTPVWMMRQAGRYLPEYRDIRAKAGDFLTMAKNPELACEVTLQPLRRFELDAAIIFSDILTVPDAMGLGLYFASGEGPRFARPVHTKNDVRRLTVADMNDLKYVFDAIRLTQQSLAGSVPLIGFAGSPWTTATYMIEGESTKDFCRIKRMMYETPELLKYVLEVLTESIIAYLSEQIKAGVNAIQIFDTWGGVLSQADYLEFSLYYMRQIVEKLKQEFPEIPIILFTKNSGQCLEKMADTGCDALGIHWTCDLADAKKRVSDKVSLQGNLDPAVLYASPKRIRESVQEVLINFGSGPGHVFNLGHGIHRDVSLDNVTVMIEAVHELSQHDKKNRRVIA